VAFFFFSKKKRNFVVKFKRMPKKDKFHQSVIDALEKDNWIITNDPLFMPTKGGFNFYIDLGVARIINAEKGETKIAIEIKSFNYNSPLYSFYEMLGQYLVYEIALSKQILTWNLWIAISDIGYMRIAESPIFQEAIEKHQLKFIIINPLTNNIVEWKE
jgi:hypothetical protein